ncbi:MAG: hypothetical protein ACXVE4_11375 [Solirubrobacteraceae bacterium]
MEPPGHEEVDVLIIGGSLVGLSTAMQPTTTSASRTGRWTQSVFKVPVSVTDKLRRRRMMTTEEYAYARAVAPADQGDAAQPPHALLGLVPEPTVHLIRI